MPGEVSLTVDSITTIMMLLVTVTGQRRAGDRAAHAGMQLPSSFPAAAQQLPSASAMHDPQPRTHVGKQLSVCSTPIQQDLAGVGVGAANGARKCAGRRSGAGRLRTGIDLGHGLVVFVGAGGGRDQTPDASKILLPLDTIGPTA
jgi:hypothetical protein